MASRLLIILLFLPSLSLAEEIEHKFIDGTIHYSFNQSLISKQTLKQYLKIHPLAYDSRYHIPPSLKLCIAKDSDYYQCGSRNLHDQNFFKNAEINISKGEILINELSSMNEIEELKGLVSYFKKSLEFGVWQRKTLLKYYKSWEVEDLNKNYKKLNIKSQIVEIIESLKTSKDVNEKWKISFYKWANTANRQYRKNEGIPPRNGWNEFLSKYKITEKIVWEEIN